MAGVGVQFPEGARNFLHNVQTGSGTRVPGHVSSEVKRQGRELTTHLHLVPRLSLDESGGAISSLPMRLMVLCLIK
jgi:hypothetical protein